MGVKLLSIFIMPRFQEANANKHVLSHAFAKMAWGSGGAVISIVLNLAAGALNRSKHTANNSVSQHIPKSTKKHEYQGAWGLFSTRGVLGVLLRI